MDRGVVLDAYALVGLLHDEPCAERVQRALERALSTGHPLPISSVNWCEVVYAIRRRRPHEETSAAISVLDALPIAVVDADRDLAARAAVLKAEHGLGLGDSFAAALALRLNMPLMTGDPDFGPLRDAGLELEWLQ